jgi:hypothetical protein
MVPPTGLSRNTVTKYLAADFLGATLTRELLHPNMP